MRGRSDPRNADPTLSLQVVVHNRLYSKAADAFPNKEVLAKVRSIAILIG